ncbi:hypothetical protein F7725_021138 [Dissostichus mawsoni]|uniref:Uncharacterized protein n=1 Tax=Dissostichus mawsoni TaxID=36200 RepID=A0A7J5YFC1_DISMA|nr:hypothetical protein F7725_021138 [Dissostichus mawsoni]
MAEGGKPPGIRVCEGHAVSIWTGIMLGLLTLPIWSLWSSVYWTPIRKRKVQIRPMGASMKKKCARSSSSSCSAVKVVRLRRCFLFRGRSGSDSTSEPSAEGLCRRFPRSICGIRHGSLRPFTDLGDAAVRDAQLPGDYARPDSVVRHLHDLMSDVVGQRSAVYKNSSELVHTALTQRGRHYMLK